MITRTIQKRNSKPNHKLSDEKQAQIILTGIFKEYTRQQIDAGLAAAEQFYSQNRHRCSCCFRWNCTNDHTFMIIDRGIYVFGACCMDCRRKICTDGETASMEANIRDYVLAEFAR